MSVEGFSIITVRFPVVISRNVHLSGVEELLSHCYEVLHAELKSLWRECDVLVCPCDPVYPKGICYIAKTIVGRVAVANDEDVSEHGRYLNRWVDDVLAAGVIEDRSQGVCLNEVSIDQGCS